MAKDIVDAPTHQFNPTHDDIGRKVFFDTDSQGHGIVLSGYIEAIYTRAKTVDIKAEDDSKYYGVPFNQVRLERRSTPKQEPTQIAPGSTTDDPNFPISDQQAADIADWEGANALVDEAKEASPPKPTQKPVDQDANQLETYKEIARLAAYSLPAMRRRHLPESEPLQALLDKLERGGPDVGDYMGEPKEKPKKTFTISIQETSVPKALSLLRVFLAHIHSDYNQNVLDAIDECDSVTLDYKVGSDARFSYEISDDSLTEQFWERDEGRLEELVNDIARNAYLIPDPDTTPEKNIFAVPIDDISELRSLLSKAMKEKAS